MKTNFAIAGIPAGFRFYQAYDSNLMLFGWVSMGIKRDALRLSYMPDLAATLAEAAAGNQPEPRFVQTVAEAAQYMAGLIRAEISADRLARIRSLSVEAPEYFAPYAFGDRCESFVCREAFELAFQYASGGRPIVYDESPADDEFAAALWEAFAADFLAAEAVAA